jgi:hypothetical protein
LIVPLAKGKDPKTLGDNYRELRASGHEHKQAVAIMLREADLANEDKKKKKKK